ncbi:hypothetical protein B0H13DRAFT_1895492 [Mycena leptocephala]|nr:hypothetical protein B0H13DRAFT_1895492 [Mycena leptocephala]
MPSHRHSHDWHPHPQQKRTGPGAPEHMRAGDCGREARGDREQECEWEWGGRRKNDEESEMAYLRRWRHIATRKRALALAPCWFAASLAPGRDGWNVPHNSVPETWMYWESDA